MCAYLSSLTITITITNVKRGSLSIVVFVEGNEGKLLRFFPLITTLIPSHSRIDTKTIPSVVSIGLFLYRYVSDLVLML